MWLHPSWTGKTYIANPYKLNGATGLSKGLLFAWNGHLGLDLVSGVRPVNTNVKEVTLYNKRTWQFAGGGVGNSDLNFGPLISTNNLGESPATWAFYATATGTGNIALACQTPNNTDRGWQIGTDQAGSSIGATFERTSGNVRKFISNTITPNVPFTLVFTYDGSNSASGINVYINGVLGTVSGTSNGSGTSAPDTVDSLYLGRKVFSTGFSHNGDIHVAAIAKRTWSAAEAREFHNNPYGIFTPPRNAVYSFGLNPGLTSNIRLHPVITGTVALYQLQSNTLDSSGLGHDLSVFSSGTGAFVPVSNVFGYQFRSAPANTPTTLSAAATSDLQFTGDYTIQFLVVPIATTGTQVFVECAHHVGSHFYSWQSNSNVQRYADTNNPGASNFTGTSMGTIGVVQHWTLRKQSNVMQLFINGAVQSTSIATAALTWVGNEFFLVGTDIGGAFQIDCTMFSIRCLNYARANSDILADYQYTLGNESDIVFNQSGTLTTTNIASTVGFVFSQSGTALQASNGISNVSFGSSAQLNYTGNVGDFEYVGCDDCSIGSTPTVSNVVPNEGIDIPANQSLQFDVLDTTEATRRIIVYVTYPNNKMVEIVHTGDTFCPKFINSTRASISHGWHYSISRLGGWMDTSITVTVDAISDSGGED